jgi:hypothetical protein
MTDRYILQKIYNDITGNYTAWIYFRICSHISMKYRPRLFLYFVNYLYNEHGIKSKESIPFKNYKGHTPEETLRARKMWLYLQILKLKNQ